MASDSDSLDPEPPDDVTTLLRGLELQPTSDLPSRVRQRIERRFLGRDLVGFYWTAITSVVMEWLSASLGRVGRRRPPEGEQR
jgi:hypothetical protein